MKRENVKCFKIDDKIYLKGHFNETEQSDEYFDMTSEMETGHSYSIFLKSDEELIPASEEETDKVFEYLSTL